MEKIQLLEITSLQISPSPNEMRKGDKQRVVGKDVLSINTDMIVSVQSGKEMEVDGKITSTTLISLMDDTYHTVPVSYRSLLEKLES